MEGDAYLGELASGIIYLLAGTRLVLLGVRTGEAPERLLGASFLSYGVSGVLYSIAFFPPKIYLRWINRTAPVSL